MVGRIVWWKGDRWIVNRDEGDTLALQEIDADGNRKPRWAPTTPRDEVTACD